MIHTSHNRCEMRSPDPLGTKHGQCQVARTLLVSLDALFQLDGGQDILNLIFTHGCCHGLVPAVPTSRWRGAWFDARAMPGKVNSAPPGLPTLCALCRAKRQPKGLGSKHGSA